MCVRKQKYSLRGEGSSSRAVGVGGGQYVWVEQRMITCMGEVILEPASLCVGKLTRKKKREGGGGGRLGRKRGREAGSVGRSQCPEE